MSAKRCTGCGEVKPLSAFHRDQRVKDGRKSTCAKCASTASAAWRSANADHVKAYSKTEAQRRKAYQREWRAANPERIRAYRRKTQPHDYLTQWRKAQRDG